MGDGDGRWVVMGGEIRWWYYDSANDGDNIDTIHRMHTHQKNDDKE